MKFLDENGVSLLWGKIKQYVADNAGSGGGGTSGCTLSQISDLSSRWVSLLKTAPSRFLLAGNTLTEGYTVGAISADNGSTLGYLLKDNMGLATTDADGFMSSEDKDKLDKLKGVKEIFTDHAADSVEVLIIFEDTSDVRDVINAATTTAAGVMTAEDKNNLDALNSDVVSPSFVRATKGDIPSLCMMGTFESILYFVDSPASLSGTGISNITNTNGDYHLCLHIKNSSVVGGGTGSADNNYYETACSASTDAFDSIEDFDKYFNKAGNIVLKNDVIYHVTTSFTEHSYFVSVENNNATTVAKGFATLAEARAYMRQKMLAKYTPDISITKITQDEYDQLSGKDSNTLYVIQG